MQPARKARLWSLFQMVVTFLLLPTGCGIFPHLPPANLQEPGWETRTGQAVWHVARGRTEIAGEVIVATRGASESFVQFSKNPFTILSSRATAQGWSVEFPSERKHYSGRGQPPKRLLWLYLPRVLAGHSLPEGWTWHMDASGWQLKNPKAGEWIEGYFEKKS